jgi:hypothetical protein
MGWTLSKLSSCGQTRGYKSDGVETPKSSLPFWRAGINREHSFPDLPWLPLTKRTCCSLTLLHFHPMWYFNCAGPPSRGTPLPLPSSLEWFLLIFQTSSKTLLLLTCLPWVPRPGWVRLPCATWKSYTFPTITAKLPVSVTRPRNSVSQGCWIVLAGTQIY